jgi:hypothetical protein
MLSAVARCRACDALIIWAVTSAGKAIPVDVVPVANGNIVLYPASPKDGKPKPLALVTSKPATGDGHRYVAHFSTCPKAAEFRSSLARKAGASKPRKS